MMNQPPATGFTALQQRTAEGSLRIIDIDTVPRSIAAPLGRALASGGERHVYIHEPFHYAGQPIDEAADSVLGATQRLYDKGEPATAITKNYARYLSDDTLEQWRSVCRGVVYQVRDPFVQAGSLLTRVINDTYLEPGASKLHQGQFTGDDLEAGQASFLAWNGWQQLGEHFAGDVQAERTAIVDGTVLACEPERVLRTVCKRLGLAYRESMITDWSPHVVNANTRQWNARRPDLDRQPTNGWIGRVMSGGRLGAVKRAPLDRSVMPGELSRYLTQVAMPIYQDIIGRQPAKPSSNRRIFLLPSSVRPKPRTSRLEIIEHKGVGHPDQLCDNISSAMVSRYAAALAGLVGGTAHGSFDKTVALGGQARVGFGYSEVLKPAGILLVGKAMAWEAKPDYVRDIFTGVVDDILRQTFNRSLTGLGAPKVDMELQVRVNSGIGAEHSPSFYTVTDKPVTEHWDHAVSNDTVASAGWFPFTPHERLTVGLSHYINGPAFKSEFPETGTDVKVMTHRVGEQTSITLCVPFIADLTPSVTYYRARKAEILNHVTSYVVDRIGPNVVVNLNTKDTAETGYLTVYGSALDKGDNGMTGRGNRPPGFISVTRPSAVESPYGKNPFNHSGRLSSAFAFDAARLIYEASSTPTEVYATTLNGESIVPRHITVLQNGKDVTHRYAMQLEQAIGLLMLPGYTQDQTALQAFRTCNGLL